MTIMRERSKGSAWDGWDIFIFVGFLVVCLFVVMPYRSCLLGLILIIVISEYLWHIGFFNYPKHRNRRNEEIAKRMEAKKRRLEIEEQVRKQMQEQQSVDLHELTGRDP